VTGTLIAVPMTLEALLVRSVGRGARVRRTGMGPRRASDAARALREEPGEALLVLGFCGGLDEHSRPGEVVVASEVLTAADEGHAQERVACSGVERLERALAAAGLAVQSGPVVCVSRLALGARRAQLHAGGAIAADMESVWLAPGAAGRPFAVVRVVLDSPSHELLRPQAAAGAVRAARALRKAAAASLHEWRPGN
jgi:4-hydroxy-3-methylbut-2-en-1-yl diphosphate reductase